MKEKAEYTVDVRGAISPFSLLKVSQVFQQMKPREAMDILGCDPDMQKDLLRILPEASCEIICAESGGDPEIARVRLVKRS